MSAKPDLAVSRCPEHGPYGPACPVCIERDALAILRYVLDSEDATGEAFREGDPGGEIGGIIGRIRGIACEMRFYRRSVKSRETATPEESRQP